MGGKKGKKILIRKCNGTGQEFTTTSSKSSTSLTSLTYLYLWDALGFFALGDELLIYFTFLWLFPLKLRSIFAVVTSIKVHDAWPEEPAST